MTLSPPITSATAIINSQALINNVQQVKKLASTSKILAVLKANAYGHGLERIAKLLVAADNSIDAFGVARIDEALALRAAGIVHPIVLLEGVFSAQDLAIVAVNDLHIVVHNQQQLDAILQAKPQQLLDKQLKVWLKVDTGMHRLGINPQSFTYFYQQLEQSSNVANNIVLMSHLACADDKNNISTNHQLALFEKVTALINQPKSCANSAGICLWPTSHYDWIRPGLMLYGVSPLNYQAQQFNEQQPPFSLQPVMTLQASLIAIQHIKKGDFVGYGNNWQSSVDTTIGVIAIGYGDGYPRHAENGTPVLLNNRIVPLVGRVSMDMITVDLGTHSQDKLGDIATLWGQGLPVEIIAHHATTIPYELLCNIKPRVRLIVN
jgi:alanine racemase